MRFGPGLLCCIATSLWCFSVTSCSNKSAHTPEQKEPLYVGPPLIILDTDLGSSTDGFFALAMLHRYEDQGRCKLFGVVVDRPGEANAAIADLTNTFFGRPTVPIGLVRNDVDSSHILTGYYSLPQITDSVGQPLFARSLSRYSSLPEGYKLYRQLLAAQPNRAVSICSIGSLSALAQLLASESDEFSALNGIELVRQKVKCAYITGGASGNAAEPDSNFRQDLAHAHSFFKHWPSDVDIVFSPHEVGASVEYPADSVMADLASTLVHPIKKLYEHFNGLNGQKMWGPMAIIQAVEGDSLFSLSERGTVALTPASETLFTAHPSGNCRYQRSGSPAWASAMLEKIRAITRMK